MYFLENEINEFENKYADFIGRRFLTLMILKDLLSTLIKKHKRACFVISSYMHKQFKSLSRVASETNENVRALRKSHAELWSILDR